MIALDPYSPDQIFRLLFQIFPKGERHPHVNYLLDHFHIGVHTIIPKMGVVKKLPWTIERYLGGEYAAKYAGGPWQNGPGTLVDTFEANTEDDLIGWFSLLKDDIEKLAYSGIALLILPHEFLRDGGLSVKHVIPHLKTLQACGIEPTWQTQPSTYMMPPEFFQRVFTHLSLPWGTNGKDRALLKIKAAGDGYVAVKFTPGVPSKYEARISIPVGRSLSQGALHGRPVPGPEAFIEWRGEGFAVDLPEAVVAVSYEYVRQLTLALINTSQGVCL